MPTGTFIGDCGEFLNYVVANTGYRSRTEWFERIEHLKRLYPFTYTKSTHNIKTQQVIEKISQKTSMRQNTIISAISFSKSTNDDSLLNFIDGQLLKNA